jgi:hypothetical protein
MPTPIREAFTPYQEAVRLGTVAHEVGINWSVVIFKEDSTVAAFINNCTQHGYRTRNEAITSEGNYAVQYHHSAD